MEIYQEALDLARFGDWETSAALLLNLFSENEDDYQVCIALSCIVGQTQESDTVNKYYKKAVLLSTSEAKLLSDQGEIFAKTGQYSQAISACKQSLATLPNLSEADIAGTYINLGFAAWKLHDLDETLYAYREAARLRPQNVSVQYRYGWALGEIGDRDGAHHLNDEASEIFRRILLLEPNNGTVYEALGASLCRQREWILAVEAYRQAVRLRPQDTIIKFGLGWALGKAANHERNASLYHEAVEVYHQILLDEPDNGTAHHALGTALVFLGEFATAIEAYREAIRCEPTNISARIDLARALRKAGKLSQSIEMYSQLSLDYPENTTILLGLGNAYDEVGNHKEAENVFKTALLLEPENPWVNHALGSVLAKQAYYIESIKHQRAAISLDPNLPLAYWWLSYALNRVGSRAEAATAYQKAVAMEPTLMSNRTDTK